MAGSAGRGGNVHQFARSAAARRRRLSVEDTEVLHLLELVAAARGVDVDALLQPSRGTARIAAARQLAMYLAHVTLGRSMTAVGRLFGRDRTTIAHACALIEDQREVSAFDGAVTTLETALESWRAEPEREVRHAFG